MLSRLCCICMRKCDFLQLEFHGTFICFTLCDFLVTNIIANNLSCHHLGVMSKFAKSNQFVRIFWCISYFPSQNTRYELPGMPVVVCSIYIEGGGG